MTHEKVLKKIKKRMGIEPTPGHNGKFFIYHAGKVASWYCDKNGEADLFHIRREADIPDSMTDYFPGWYPSNVTQMLDDLCPLPSKFPVGSLVQAKCNKRATRMGYADKVGLVQAHSYTGSVQVYWGENPKGQFVHERDIILVSV